MKNHSTKHLLAAALCLLFSFSIHAHHDDPIIRAIPGLKTEVKNIKPSKDPAIHSMTKADIASSQFIFPELEASIAEYEMALMMPPEGDNLTPFMIEIGNGKVSAKVKKAKEIVQKAIDIGNKIDLLTGGDLVKMPIYKTQTIGQTEVTIVFNSATIHPQYAEIQVFARIELPHKDFEGQPVVLFFGANNIFFSQEKGIIRGNLELLADFAFKIGEEDPKAGIWLSKAIPGNLISDGGTENFLLDDEYAYTGTYINFDCEGFKEMGIGGRVYFSRDWVKPTDEFGVPLEVPNDIKSPTPRTWGEFQFTAQDWNDILVSVDILDPFVLTKWEDMSFHLRHAHLDLSSYRNPPNIPYAIEPNIWEGVYIDTIAITLPKPFKRVKESYKDVGDPPADGNHPLPERERIRVSATHLLMDETGVSGQFAIDGQVPLIGGAIMAGEWGWSLDHIGITLIQSDITKFEFGGQLGVPLLSKDGPLSYTGKFDFTLHQYSFTAGGIGEKATIPVWNAAQIVMVNEAELEVTVVENEFDAALTFPDLALVLGTEKDYANSLKGSKVKLPGIKFTDLRLATSQPYVSYGSINVQTGDSKLMEFPFNLSAYKMVTPPDNPEQLNFEFTLDLNLMGQNETGVEAKGDLKLIGDYKRDINGARHWEYRTLEFVGARVTVSLSQVWAQGTLCLFEEDEIYGDGFYANVHAKIIGDNLHEPSKKGMFNLDMMAVFGSTSGYRYFMVDGFVGGDAISVPLFGPFYLDGFGGGVFHNMKPHSYVENGTEAPGQACANVNSTSGIKYVPNSETKLGFNFACGISTTSNLMTGLLTCIVRFDQSMALQNITFWGVGNIMVGSKLSERLIPGFAELKEKIKDNAVPLEQLKKNNKATATATQVNPNPVPENAIKAAIGISLDFVNGFSLHGFADVSIKVYDKPGPPKPNEPPAKLILVGRGTLDLLLAGNDWHFYLGGYYPNSYGAEIRVPDFFNSGGFVTLAPVNVTIDYQDFKISANAYFLTGNTIPGPPPPAPEVVDFFGEEANESNRHLLDCSPNSRALGTGIAFGASAFIDFTKVKKGLFGSCFAGVKLNIKGGAGFDLALLKFDKETICSLTGDNPQGLNGFRAGGRIFVFIDIEGKHVTCLPIPPLGVGVKIRFDVPNPSYFEILAILKVGKEFKFKLGIGDECGAPCVSGVLLD